MIEEFSWTATRAIYHCAGGTYPEVNVGSMAQTLFTATLSLTVVRKDSRRSCLSDAGATRAAGATYAQLRGAVAAGQHSCAVGIYAGGAGSSHEVIKALGIVEVKTRIADLGADVAGSTPQALGADIDAEVAKWKKVAKQAGIKAEI